MPYNTSSDVPTYVPRKHRQQWMEVWNSSYRRAKKEGKSDKEAEQSAFAQSNGVAGPNAHKKFMAAMTKADDEESRDFADALIEALQRDFENLPLSIRAPLEAAALSGVGQGMLQIDVGNAAMLSAANTIAEEYARDRAAELVGMRQDVEGNLVENPDAKWAISDTTRARIREIVSEAFTEDTPIAQMQEDIQAALEEEANGSGIFSDARARMIAETEVARAQTGGNFAAWQKSGVVKKIKWTTAEDEKVCEDCTDNDGAEVELGMPFPDGSIIPPGHPLCRCVVVVSEVTDS